MIGWSAELANRRYNNCANRAYYACFQAAIAALIRIGVRPGADGQWSHSAVQAQFISLFINRRKRIPAEFRDALPRLFLGRQEADYEAEDISERQATRMVRLASAFIAAIEKDLKS